MNIDFTVYDSLFVLTDTTTNRLCWPLLKDEPALKGAKLITVEPSDEHKDVESLSAVWAALQKGGATRHSLLMNLGGGMITDLGGFAAATFKRGISFVHIPTTLLGMVDASLGGKTGINFGGLKNEVGVFCQPKEIVLDVRFLSTLDHRNLLSGYAEMLKHGLLSSVSHWAELLTFDLNNPDLAHLQTLIHQSVEFKRHIVAEDPTEKGIRKALNLGHTVGHAFESLALSEHRPVLHGYAVAWGLVCELYLSARYLGFPKDKLQQTIQFVREQYGVFIFDCKSYDRLYELMLHDKKNISSHIRFSLLEEIGIIALDREFTKDEIFDMLDFYRESMGC